MSCGTATTPGTLNGGAHQRRPDGADEHVLGVGAIDHETHRETRAERLEDGNVDEPWRGIRETGGRRRVVDSRNDRARTVVGRQYRQPIHGAETCNNSALPYYHAASFGLARVGESAAHAQPKRSGRALDKENAETFYG